MSFIVGILLRAKRPRDHHSPKQPFYMLSVPEPSAPVPILFCHWNFFHFLLRQLERMAPGGLDQYLTFTDTDKARGFPIRPTGAPPSWDDITRQFIGHGGHPRGPIRAINSLSFAQLPPDALISRVLEVGEIREQMARTSCGQADNWTEA